MKIKDLIKKHEAVLKKTEGIETMEAFLKEAFLNRCRVWFGDHWSELEITKTEIKPGLISVSATYEGVTLEIGQKVNDRAKVITPIGEYILPTISWGKERFPKPLSEINLAQIFFDIQLSKEE